MGNLLRIESKKISSLKNHKKSKGERLGWMPFNSYKPSFMKEVIGNGKIIKCSCKNNTNILLVP